MNNVACRRNSPALEGLQALLDAEAAEFLAEAAALRRERRDDELRRQATLFMQHAWEEFAEVTDGLLSSCQPAVDDVQLSVF